MVRLVRAHLDARGWGRRGAGTGFTYVDEQGARIRDEDVVERLRALAVPPAWRDVWFSPNPRSHILATGTDGAGRRQYIYHPAWIEAQGAAKFARLPGLATALPQARARVRRDLRSDPGSRGRALAAGFRLVDTVGIRVGDARHTAVTGHRGLTTLAVSHATVAAETVTLDFPGKSGLHWHVSTTDHDLAVAVRSLTRGRSARARLLAHRDGRRWIPVRAAELNAYVRDVTGTDATTKDLRTLLGSATAARELARAGALDDPREQERAIRAAIVATADVLGNTPAVARASYVDPRVLELFRRGRVADAGREPAAAYLDLVEEA
ncbi:DNA topoisomerase IB [Sanguibacter sp. A247]|uniref:DNA topoisomerase IB n=1 Tax=unclassified Sanguibacter TaxID=2645534 RepID=UPI003FD7DE86